MNLSKVSLPVMQCDAGCNSCLVPLTRGISAIIDRSDCKKVSGFKWFAVQGRKTWYAARKGSNDRTIYMHRWLLNAKKGFEVDHKNRNGLDNRRSNLQEVSHARNMMNRGKPSNNTSGHKNISKCNQTGKWSVYITVNGKRIWFGRHKTKAIALSALRSAHANEKVKSSGHALR